MIRFFYQSQINIIPWGRGLYMKRYFSIVAALLLLSSPSIKAQSDAGAIFLLISPGARAGGMGEAQVAVANDA
ncbi:MAG: hypothetical protein Ct9H90mP7_0020 [Candidatus Neomarinimicrobiota bacterium]|nr:MAG: hypothetical protein Ct9H90mP7_0020 [Candidatus Neomarinimicrobiota bacterium]